MTATALVVLLAGHVAGWALAGRRRALPATPSPAAGSVSIVVPARDEAARLPRLLGALAHADPAPLEVIVVDDGSTDATPSIAAASGALVLAAEPPPGWTGKASACQRGAAAATGDVLVFLDADTEPAPAFVASIAAVAADTGGIASAQPAHRVERPYERLSAGPALVSLLGAGTGGPPGWRWWRRPVAFGPAIAVPRDVYRRIGGHEAVRAAVAEDLALAAAADGAGVAVTSFLGGDLIGYRMYPEGAGRLVEGWSKNLAAGAASTPPVRLAATVLWVTAALQAPLLLATADGGAAVAVAAVAYGAFAVQVGVLLRRVGRFGAATAVAYPVVLVALAALLARSIYLVARGADVPWRGRKVPVRAS